MLELADTDEFGDAGWVDDDDLMLAASQAEGVASKRRRLNSGGSEIVKANKDNSTLTDTIRKWKC